MFLNEVGSISNNSLLLILAGIVLFLLIAFVVFKIAKKQKNKIDKVKVNDELISSILGCFNKSDIVSITSEVSRVKFEVKNLDSVDVEKLKTISTGIFITGNQIKVMFKDSADEIVDKLNKTL